MSNPTSHPFYYTSVFRYQRVPTRVVRVGSVAVGGSNPLRLQSMITADPLDTVAAVEQIKRLVEVGGEIVRLTVPNLKAAENLVEIKNKLIQSNCLVPLVADVHFTPNAALKAAEVAEKVRINPGNYVDRKRFDTVSWSPQAQQQALARIEEKLIPLISALKKYRRALRLGVNHGSLSDRIVSRYGDTPLGMVEAALEFLTLFERHHFFEIVLSMKSSNPIVMVQAYRLLLRRLRERKQTLGTPLYPFHLGVTEAGLGEDGRIKSALGIGTLLSEGIGDTIRVSLTEAPEKEIPVARKLVAFVKKITQAPVELQEMPLSKSPFEFARRKTTPVKHYGGGAVPKVVVELPSSASALLEALVSLSPAPDAFCLSDSAPLVWPAKTVPLLKENYFSAPLQQKEIIRRRQQESPAPLFIQLSHQTLSTISQAEAREFLQQLSPQKTVLVLAASGSHLSQEIKKLLGWLEACNLNFPCFALIAADRFSAGVSSVLSPSESETLQVELAASLGLLFLDGLLDGLWVKLNSKTTAPVGSGLVRALFSILQASRQRIFKPDYISCPSCGRTLFELQAVTKKIQQLTSHLGGVKIAVMGCIVNGPGEMADADFGYVGSGPGKITLYKGKKIVARAIPQEEALQALKALLKKEGVWREKP